MSAARIVRGICISDRMPSCMRAPPEAGTTISAASRATARLAAVTNASPTATPIEPPTPARGGALGGWDDPPPAAPPHRPPNKRKTDPRDNARHTADPPLGDRERVIGGPGADPERGLVFAQPLGVALAVAKAQRIG